MEDTDSSDYSSCSESSDDSSVGDNIDNDGSLLPMETADPGSEASDGTTDKCPVCICPFTGQDIGTPEACDHYFCLDCITEWSKNVNTCPVDRTVFHLILARHSVDGVVYKKIPVRDRELELEEEDEDLTFCEICNECDREDVMLLCDGCDQGYHMDCLDSPLSSVPVNEWFCSDCARNNLPVEDKGAASNSVWEAMRGHRQIPRTQVSERVRAHIQRRRRRMVITSGSEDELEEISNFESVLNAVGGGVGQPHLNTKPVTRKRKVKRRRRKRVKRSKTKGTTLNGKKTKKKKVPTATLR